MIWRLPSGVIKHGLLETGPVRQVIFLTKPEFSRGFSCQPCLIARGYTRDEIVLKIKGADFCPTYFSWLMPTQMRIHYLTWMLISWLTCVLITSVLTHRLTYLLTDILTFWVHGYWEELCLHRLHVCNWWWRWWASTWSFSSRYENRV